MIVKCVRCNREFSSSRSHTHVCPTCHFVFGEGDSSDLKIVRSSDLVRQNTGHHLQEEAEHKCAFHLDADAIAYCKHCGRPVCYACSIETESGYSCEPCNQSLKTAPPGEPAEQRAEPQAEAEIFRRQTVSQVIARGPYVAWEYRGQIGRVNALFTTWRHTLFRPLSFFHGIPIVGDYRSPLLYGLFWTLVGSAGGFAWKLLLYIYPTIILFLEGKSVQLSLQLSQTYVLVAAALVLSPLVALMMLMAACAIYHVFVALFTRQHAGFEATLRVICYSTGTNVFFFLPLLGALLGGIWQLVLVTAGLKEVHRISFPLALTIALVPYTLLLILAITFTVWAVTGNKLGVDEFLHDLLLSLRA